MSEVVVIDIGSGYTKAGLSKNELPSATFPTIIAKRKNNIPSFEKKNIWKGNEVYYVKDIPLQVKHLIDEKRLFDFDDFEEFFNYTFYDQLKIAPEERAFLLSDIKGHNMEFRERTAQKLFEKYSVRGFTFGNNGSLALNASGRTNGFVLDSGYLSSQTVSIYDGVPLQQSILKLDIAGKSLNENLRNLFSYEKKEKNQTLEDISLENLKEQLCYVALDYDQEMKKDLTIEYQLPDGKKLKVNTEAFKCSEALFNPSLLGIEGLGLPQTILSSIEKSGKEIQKDLFENILLCGGTSSLKGFEKRLGKELELLSKDSKIKFVESKIDPRYSIWVGGSILASLSTFKKCCTTIEEYDEIGLKAIHYKCI